VLAVVLAWLGKPSLSGISYALIGLLQTGLGMRHGKRGRELVIQMKAATG
jgi:hypothetical protein